MLVEGGRGWSGRENLRTVQMSGQPLGVECRACRHRGLVPLQAAERVAASNMTSVKSLPLVCRCGSRDWLAVLFTAPGDDPHAWQGSPGPAF